jgi:hypothetical protein
MYGRSSVRNDSMASSTAVPFSAARFSVILSVIGVWMKAGETALVSNPSDAYEREKPLDSARMPALTEQ